MSDEKRSSAFNFDIKKIVCLYLSVSIHLHSFPGTWLKLCRLTSRWEAGVNNSTVLQKRTPNTYKFSMHSRKLCRNFVGMYIRFWLDWPFKNRKHFYNSACMQDGCKCLTAVPKFSMSKISNELLSIMRNASWNYKIWCKVSISETVMCIEILRIICPSIIC